MTWYLIFFRSLYGFSIIKDHIKRATFRRYTWELIQYKNHVLSFFLVILLSFITQFFLFNKLYSPRVNQTESVGTACLCWIKLHYSFVKAHRVVRYRSEGNALVYIAIYRNQQILSHVIIHDLYRIHWSTKTNRDKPQNWNSGQQLCLYMQCIKQTHALECEEALLRYKSANVNSCHWNQDFYFIKTTNPKNSAKQP